MESAKSKENEFRIQTLNRKYNGFGNQGKSLSLTRNFFASVFFLFFPLSLGLSFISKLVESKATFKDTQSLDLCRLRT